MIFPSIPARFFVKGDKHQGVKLISLARKMLFELDRDLKFNGQITGRPLPTGNRSAVDNTGKRIDVSISYGIYQATIFVPVVGKTKQVEPLQCPCCLDCLMIGKIINAYHGTYYSTVSVDVCQGVGSAYSYVQLDDVPVIDGNKNHAAGNRIILYASPALQSTADLVFSHDQRAVEQEKPGKVWQVFNCMSESGLDVEGADYTAAGIDNTVFTITDDCCAYAGSDIPTEEVEPPAEPDTVPLTVYATSFLAAYCLELIP